MNMDYSVYFNDENFLSRFTDSLVPPDYFSEPSGSPGGLKEDDTTSTSIVVTWNEVPGADKNGIILSYTVRYQAIGGITVNAPVSFTNVTFPTRMVNLTGLIKNQRYNISVLASTVEGDGPYSPPISASTNEDSKSTFLYDIRRYKAYYKAPNKTVLVSFGAGNHYHYFSLSDGCSFIFRLLKPHPFCGSTSLNEIIGTWTFTQVGKYTRKKWKQNS